MILPPLSFAAPWALAALALLPLLWWLLRVVPPAPRRQSFPAIALLLGLAETRRAAARTPLWLVLLRLLLAALVILAVAHPLLNARPVLGGGPLLVVVDDGWAAAKGWPQRRQSLDEIIAQAERDGRPVALLTTAPPADGAPLTASRLLPASQAGALAQAIEPHPWPSDRAAAAAALAVLPHEKAFQVIWLTDGLEDGTGKGAALAEALRRLGPLTMILPPPTATARLLVPPVTAAADLTPRLLRAPGLPAETVTVRAADEAGRGLARQTVTLAAGTEDAEISLKMPSELRNRVARLEIEDDGTAGAVVLLDERWRRRPVGLVDEHGRGSNSPLLDDLYYSERALAPLAELRRAPLAELLRRPLSLLVVPGGLPEDQRPGLRAWVENGGLLLRLAGPTLTGNPDDLLPVRLRGGGRSLGGAMSWTKPMTLAAMPDSGPFAGLAVPGDLRITSQVLAEPAVDLNERTWARLEDGTPLVTGAPLGKGWLVLIHTTVWPSWSNLGLSGLFPQMLERLLDLSKGMAGAQADHPLPPIDLLDGFGRLVPPSGAAEALPAAASAPPPPSPRHPPGYYGDDGGRRAVNLGAALPRPLALRPPLGVSVSPLGVTTPERDLQPPLLLAALLVFLTDLLAVLALRGLLRRRAATLALTLAVLAAAPTPPARAAGDDITRAAALETRLAYIRTGDSQTDDLSRDGLAGLSRMLVRRTTASLGEPMGLDVERDPLVAFPLLYWPVTGHQAPLPPAARDKVNDYLHHGGMILFDSQDRGEGGPERLRSLTEGLEIPPLAAVTEEHVLSRSFYLLHDLPGRFQGTPVFVAAGTDPANDNVSPVVIGSADWTGAWATDISGNALRPVVPGGEQQREMAVRFGINLVMYALTGSYKADQVHLPAILERMKR